MDYTLKVILDKADRFESIHEKDLSYVVEQYIKDRKGVSVNIQDTRMMNMIQKAFHIENLNHAFNCAHGYYRHGI